MVIPNLCRFDLRKKTNALRGFQFGTCTHQYSRVLNTESHRLGAPSAVLFNEKVSSRAHKHEMIEERTSTAQQMTVALPSSQKRMESVSSQFAEKIRPDIECVAHTLEQMTKNIELKGPSRAGTKDLGKPVSFEDEEVLENETAR